MNQYKIYENPLGTREAIKQGWSWPAFFFSWIWAFVKKMNRVAGITLGCLFIWTIILAGISASVEGDNERDATAMDTFNSMLEVSGQDPISLHSHGSLLLDLLSLAGFAVPIMYGIKGNSWRENNLLERGFLFKKDVAALTDEAAIMGYVNDKNHQSESVNHTITPN